jgi:hypothetical protein
MVITATPSISKNLKIACQTTLSVTQRKFRTVSQGKP